VFILHFFPLSCVAHKDYMTFKDGPHCTWCFKRISEVKIWHSLQMQMLMNTVLRKAFGTNFTFVWPCIATNFLYNKINIRTNFPNLFCQGNLHVFGQFLCPSSGVFHCTFSTDMCHVTMITAFKPVLLKICYQSCMTHTSAECTVENSWWWAKELPETSRVSWQNKLGKLVLMIILL